jgi:hypothetical protein
MARKVEKLDMNVKNYLENQMRFVTVSCTTAGHSVTYKMHHKETGLDMTYEMCGDGRLNFTIKNECRTLPKVEDLQAQLPEKVDEQTIVRLVFQIVTRLLDNGQDETKVNIRKQFERHAKKLN